MFLPLLPSSHQGRPPDRGRAAAQPRHCGASGAGSLGHRACVWAAPPCSSACGAPQKSQLGACRSHQPTHTYCRFPHAGSRLRHWFGRFCFDRFSCCSTQRLRSLGLERQLVGDLERLPQREDDLVRQVLQRGHRKHKAVNAHKRPGPARSVCSADAALGEPFAVPWQVTSCCTPGQRGAPGGPCARTARQEPRLPQPSVAKRKNMILPENKASYASTLSVK